jgi:hypothetical protein
MVKEIQSVPTSTHSVNGFNSIENTPHQQSSLPPVVTNPNSPYYSATGAPVTTGDYEQRVQNVLKLTQKRRFRLSFNWRVSPYFVGGFLVASTTAAVYFSNVLIVYEKERLVEQLLNERARLRSLSGKTI